MTDKNEKYLKPIKDICLKIKSEESISAYIKEIKVIIKKGDFFAYYTFKMLLELLQENPKLKISKTKEIFKILDLINHDNNSIKKSTLRLLFNYIIFIKKESDENLQQEIFNICKLEEQPSEDTRELYLIILEQCSRFKKIMENKKNIDDFNSSLQLLIKSIDAQEKDLILKLFKLVEQHIIYCYSLDSSGSKVMVFLEEAIIKGLDSCNLTLPSGDDVFLIYIKSIKTIIHYGGKSAFKMCSKFLETIQKLLSSEDHKLCNTILIEVIKMCSKEQIDEASLKKFHSLSYKNVKNVAVSQSHHETALIVTKMINKFSVIFYPSAQTFIAYHELIFSLFHVLKDIKNNENLYTCCSDTKRHEIFNLILGTMGFSTMLISKGIYNSKTAKLTEYYTTYGLKIISELKCTSKEREFKTFYNHLYNLLYEFIVFKPLVLPNIKSIFSIIESLYKMYCMISENLRNCLTNANALIENIFHTESDTTIDQSKIFATALVYVYVLEKKKYESDKDLNLKTIQRLLMKTIYSIRRAALKAKYESAVDFIQRDFKSSNLSCFEHFLIIEEIQILEISALYRYNSIGVEEIASMFEKVCDNEENLKVFTCVCQSINDKVLNLINIDKFYNLYSKLEQKAKLEDPNDLEINLALATYSYYIFYLHEKETEVLSASCLQDEIKLLNYLNKSLQYFTNVLLKILKNRDEAFKITSTRLLITILDNISIQFLLRGIEYKDLEAQSLLWNFLENLQCDNEDIKILSSAQYFLQNFSKLTDRSGNYVKISKKLDALKIDDIVMKSRGAFEKLVKNYDEIKMQNQVSILSYLLSLWIFYMNTGRRADGIKIWTQFEQLWSKSNIKENITFYNTLKAQIYYGMVEVNMKCCKRNACNMLNHAVIKLLNVRSITSDFVNIFQLIYQTITWKVLNNSLNRLLDVDHYSSLMLSLKKYSSKKGYFFKTLEYISLSILRNLNMEKMDAVKEELKEISNLLNIKDEILIETPLKEIEPFFELRQQQDDLELRRKAIAIPPSREILIETPLKDIEPFFDLHQQQDDLKIRREAIAPSREFHINLNNDTSQDYAHQLTEQLQSFVHKTSCKCDVCEYPQLKLVYFQIGCHYARLLWLMDKLNISRSFSEHAMDPWRFFSSKLLRSKNNELFAINKKEFLVFSIRWLFQVADTFIAAENYSEVEEIYTEIELLCTDHVPDYDCIKQGLYTRKENLEFILKHGTLRKVETLTETPLVFAEFIKLNNKKIPELTKADIPVKATATKTFKYVSIGNSKIKSPVNAPVSTSLENIPGILPTAASTKPVKTIDTAKIPTLTEQNQTKKIRSTRLKVIKQDSVIFVDESDDSSVVSTPKPPKKVPKTPGATKVIKKNNDKVNKSKEEDVIDLTNETPFRRTRRML